MLIIESSKQTFPSMVLTFSNNLYISSMFLQYIQMLVIAVKFGSTDKKWLSKYIVDYFNLD